MKEAWTPSRLSPDGEQVAFDSHEGGTINVWTAPVEGGPAKQLTFDKDIDGFPFLVTGWEISRHRNQMRR
jgi:Tol biopolymer transport system component